MSTTTETVDIDRYALQRGRAAKQAARRLATTSSTERNACLHTVARLLRSGAAEVLSANRQDVAGAPRFGLSDAQVDRLRLDETRIEKIAVAVEQIAALPDPIGLVIEGRRLPNGLALEKVAVPLGVIFFIYESRPNVTVDAAALCLKSGNAILLRGGKEARQSNLALGAIVSDALREHGIPSGASHVIEVPDRELVGHLLGRPDLIDLAIPRGGKGLIHAVAEQARVPVLKHYEGICHVYVHGDAEADKAVPIVVNSKCQRPSVCNAAETLLIDGAAAQRLLPKIAEALVAEGVELRGCELTRSLVSDAKPAEPRDYRTEHLDLVMNVKVVEGLPDAIEHIAEHGSGHTDAIVTESVDAASRFADSVDSAAVMINASTRFHDGGEFGMGAEIGISTDKFHARGPCGLRELTSSKYVVRGSGHVRG